MPMRKEDEQELLRLTNLLEQLSLKLEPDSELLEPLKKAAIALSVSWIHGLRSEVENLYAPKELTKAELDHLRSLGINPDD